MKKGAFRNQIIYVYCYNLNAWSILLSPQVANYSKDYSNMFKTLSFCFMLLKVTLKSPGATNPVFKGHSKFQKSLCSNIQGE